MSETKLSVPAMRRKLIAEWVSMNNASAADAAGQFKVSLPTIRQACIENNVALSRNDSTPKRRRLAIAESVRDGDTTKQAADRYRVSLQTVRKACHEHGVEVQKSNPARSFAILARMLAGDNHKKIGREFGITRQRVSQVRKLAEQAGIKLPICND